MDTHALLFAQPPAGREDWTERVRPPPRRLAEQRIHAAILRIEEDVGASFNLDVLAAGVGLSPFHFHRLFLEVMGETPGAYARRVRLDTAAVLLQRGDDSITAIAATVGYGSIAAFSRVFSRQFGHTPQAFRLHARSQVPQPEPRHFARAAAVRLQARPGMRAWAMRFHGGYHMVEDCWSRFAEALRAHGVDPDPLTVVGVVRDNPEIVATELIRYDCCVLADDGWTPPPALAMAVQDWSPRRYAVADHDGPYYTVFDAYKTLVWGWLPTSGEHIAHAPALELYHAPPWRAGGEAQRMSVAVALR